MTTTNRQFVLLPASEDPGQFVLLTTMASKSLSLAQAFALG